MAKKQEYGFKIKWLEKTSSTQEEARRLFLSGEKEVAVAAGRQSRGRGRHTRVWHSPSGGLYCSFVVPLPRSKALWMTMLSSVAVVRALGAYGLKAKIKWPNDVLVRGRKICGILSEYVRDGVIVGIGINVNNVAADFPRELRKLVISMRDVKGRSFQRKPIFKRLCQEMWEVVGSLRCGDVEELVEAWQELDILSGRPVTFQDGRGMQKGLVLGLSHDGGLKVKTGSGEEVLYAEDVHLIQG